MRSADQFLFEIPQGNSRHGVYEPVTVGPGRDAANRPLLGLSCGGSRGKTERHPRPTGAGWPTASLKHIDMLSMINFCSSPDNLIIPIGK